MPGPLDLGFTEHELAVAASSLPGGGVSALPFLDKNTVIGGTETEVIESSFESSEVQKLAESSLDFLAALCMPLIFQYCYPPVFLAAWDWLTNYVTKVRDFSQLVLGLPRGFGKTTLIKIFIIYCILFTQKKFILVISSTAGLAENILADVADMLEEPNIKNTFGDWKLGLEKDTQAVKKFGFRGRNIILAALGAGSSLRGLNMKNERPDVMIFEDFQTREAADSEVESKKLESWMVGTAMKAKSPHGCLYVFIGNMYPTKHSILRKLKNNKKWVKFIAGGILASGESLWPELQPIEQLMAEFENDLEMGHPEIFYSEVLNDENASANNLIDLSKIPPYPFEDDDISGGKFVVIDPATDKKDSDFVSVGYFEVHNGIPVLRSLVDERLSPGDTIREAIKFCLENNCNVVAIESNAYQYTLKYWSEFICRQLGIEGINFVEVYSGSYSKNSRILAMFRELLKGETYIHPSVKAAVYLLITQFNPLKRDNTDGPLDLLTYAHKVMEMYGEYVSSTTVIQEQEWSGAKVEAINWAF